MHALWRWTVAVADAERITAIAALIAAVATVNKWTRWIHFLKKLGTCTNLATNGQNGVQ
jgi:hypothetical protein